MTSNGDDILFNAVRVNGGASTSSDDGTTARMAARALTRELLERVKTSEEPDARAMTIVRALCDGSTHARAQDELANRAREMVRACGRFASGLSAELASGLASARTSANARALTRALVEVVCEGFDGDLARECASASAHPLTRALRAHADAGAGLLEATTSKVSSGLSRDFEAMRPFIMRALLEHPAPAPRSLFPALLHARLMGATCGNGESAPAILELCARALGAYRAPTSESRAWIASAAGEVIDAIECRLYDVGDDSARNVLALVTEGLVRQLRSAALDGDSTMPFIGALKRLSEHGDVSECVELIPCLSLVQSTDETAALLALLAPHFPLDGPARSLSSRHASAALMLPKESGARLALSLAMSRDAQGVSMNSTRNGRQLGDRTRDGFMSRTLSTAWYDGDADSIDRVRACIRDDDVTSCTLELACLVHPSSHVRECAAEKLREKLCGKAAHGTSEVTMILLHLHTECERSARIDDAAKAALAMLTALAAGASDFVAAPIVLRAIAPLMSTKPGESAPSPRLHALALRLLAEMWINNREFGARLKGALEDASTSREPAVVIGCASAFAAAARAHPFRATEFVLSIQGCLKSKFPAAQALALEAIDTMCEYDALDFFPAFKVVTRHIPSLPQHPLVAQKWIRLIRHAGRDASKYPDAAVTFIEIIWNAINTSSHPRVRGEAWSSLSLYDSELISEIGAPSMSEIAQHALSENLGKPFDGAMAMLRTVTKQEFIALSRTSLIARDSQQLTHPPPSDPLIYRVTQTIPKKLLDSQPCAGARLLMFRPPKGRSETLMSRDKAESYRIEFNRAAKEMRWIDWWHGGLLYRSWTRFSKRWFDAEVSARSGGCDIDDMRAEARASMNATAMKSLEDVTTPDELQNIALFLVTPALESEGGFGAELGDFLLSILQEKMSVVGAERGLCVALGIVGGSLADRGNERLPTKIADALIQQLSDCQIDGADKMGAVAEALGLLCHGLSRDVTQGESSSWRVDLTHRICRVLFSCLNALGASVPSIQLLGIRSSSDGIVAPKGDVSDAIAGSCVGLSRVFCALDVFDDEARRTTAWVEFLTNEVTQGSFPHSLALPVALKPMLDRKHNIQSETVALTAMTTTACSENALIRAVSCGIMGIMLDHGCAVPIEMCQRVLGETSGKMRDDTTISSARAFFALALSSALGAPWDGYVKYDARVNATSDESSVFAAPLLWGGIQGKSQAKGILKTIESVALAPDEIALRSLRDISTWTLAMLSDRVAQLAVLVSSGTHDSKSSVSNDTVIGCMMQAILNVNVAHPDERQMRGAAMAFSVLTELTRLPNAGWSNAFSRWWRVATSNQPDEAKSAREALQSACIRMCQSHPEMSLGRHVLEQIATTSEAEFTNLSAEAQLLIMRGAPSACSLNAEGGVTAVERFINMAYLSRVANGCVSELWKSLISVSEDDVAFAAVRSLASRLDLTNTHILDEASLCISKFKSSTLRAEAVRTLRQEVKPIICARLFKIGQARAETLISLATWPKETRMLTLKLTAGHIARSTSTLRAQMMHEAVNLGDCTAIPCIAILAVAWGPMSALLNVASIEQCTAALPCTLPHLLKGELSGLSDAIVSSALRNLKGAHARVAIDVLLEMRNDVTNAVWAQVVDALA